MYSLNFLSLIALFTLCFSIVSYAQVQQAVPSLKQYDAKRVDQSPILDGALEASFWETSDWSSGFSINGKPVISDFDTQFKVLYNQTHLFVAVLCRDPHPDSIPLYPSPRDNSSNDWLEVDFDTDLNQQSAYSFSVSPYGVRTDQLITGDDADFDDSWHPKWQVKTKVTPQGWIAEIAIPFQQLNFSKSKTQTWGFQIVRKVSRRDEVSYWAK